ncbi:MAG: hypothetical protein ABEI86_05980 [Halobacteriaceae archaeon]
MYSKSRILKGIKNPRHAISVFTSDSIHNINRGFSRNIIDRIRKPTNIFEEDWDNLLILDGCTNDLIQQYSFDYELNDTRWSAGSHTVEFMRQNLAKTVQDDIVWITANPQVSKFENKIFKVIHAWDRIWNDNLGTVLPEDMYDLTIEVANQYPNKRLIVHFIQPHYPFIGEFGRSELPSHASFTVDGYIEDDRNTKRIWKQLQEGNVSEEVVRKAYRENLEIALPYVRRLTDDLIGKTILTADHGNEFGKRAIPIPIRLFGHPEGYRTENLTCVPWIEFTYEDRKRIVSGDIGNSDVDKSEIESRLQHLGYK